MFRRCISSVSSEASLNIVVVVLDRGTLSRPELHVPVRVPLGGRPDARESELHEPWLPATTSQGAPNYTKKRGIYTRMSGL